MNASLTVAAAYIRTAATAWRGYVRKASAALDFLKKHLQGVQGQIFMFQLALRDRNMQVRFGLKVLWES